ncbi:DoxX family protein [Sphingomonas bacterium]|uniref:DoxX family protein n=1 Tax=Sphingomonas bacterium TaxID=1895847 RepID=UPI0015755553|nr:DoxX family protein [Sphingomonas bacterium]
MTDGRARRLALGALVLFYAVAGVAHLVVTDAMVRITPAWVPFPHAVVVGTGLCELAGAAGLMTRRWRVAAGWALAAYAVCVFPANIKHAIHDLGGHTGLGIGYHGPRLLLQPLITWWALWASGATDWPWHGERRLAPGVRVP